MNNLELLAANWLEAKASERCANLKRISIEEAMMDYIKPNKEGATTTALDNGYRIVVTNRTNFRADIEALENIVSGWDRALVPLKTQTVLDDTKLKDLREHHPKLWREVAEVVESNPAKTHISVVV
jgi:hypothetical protein